MVACSLWPFSCGVGHKLTNLWHSADKTDVYSFGVVMMELITGLPAVTSDLNPPQLCLRVKDFIKVRMLRNHSADGYGVQAGYGHDILSVALRLLITFRRPHSGYDYGFPACEKGRTQGDPISG